jgi:hypothetical protein
MGEHRKALRPTLCSEMLCDRLMDVPLSLSGEEREQRGPDLVVGEGVVVSGAGPFRHDEAEIDGVAQVFPNLKLRLSRPPVDTGQDTGKVGEAEPTPEDAGIRQA